MTILCYHSVDPDWESPLAVTPSAFGEQVVWLASHRRVVDLPATVGSLGGTGRLPKGAVALTFDDGFEEIHRHALPVLIRHGVPATVFLVAGTLTDEDRPVDWVEDPPARPLRTLSREQVLEMHEAGVAFGSHSYAHRDLVELSEEECERDLRDSREVLGDLLGAPVELLAYPRGLHDARVRSAARAAGFRYAFSLPERREPAGPLAIPRVGVYRGNEGARFRLKMSRWYLTARTSPLYSAIRRVGGSVSPRARLG